MRHKWFFALAALCLAGGAHATPIAGSTSGVFENPTGGPGMVVTGVGTDTFTWGTPIAPGGDPNSLMFAGASFDTETEMFFGVGTVDYFNGSVAVGTEADSVDLGVTISFTNPSGLTETLTYMLNLVNTPNTGTPEENADRVEFSILPPETFFIDGVPHTLQLEVGTVTGEGFSTQSTFSVLEQGSATAAIRGIVTSNLTGVPEPTTLTLIAIGLAGLGFRRKYNPQ